MGQGTRIKRQRTKEKGQVATYNSQRNTDANRDSDIDRDTDAGRDTYRDMDTDRGHGH